MTRPFAGSLTVSLVSRMSSGGRRRGGTLPRREAAPTAHAPGRRPRHSRAAVSRAPARQFQRPLRQPPGQRAERHGGKDQQREREPAPGCSSRPRVPRGLTDHPPHGQLPGMAPGFRVRACLARARRRRRRRRLVERFSALGRAEARFARDAGAAMLRSLGGNSPFLADLAVREAATLRAWCGRGRMPVGAPAWRASPPSPPRRRVRRWRRHAPGQAGGRAGGRRGRYRRRVARSSASPPRCPTWPEARCRSPSPTCSRAAHGARRDLLCPTPTSRRGGCGFAVLGMGKLGARELNFSSDIDLVLLHDPDRGVYHGSEPGAFYTRIARGLVGSDGGARRRRLRVPHRPAAAPRPRRDAALHRTLPAAISLLREHGPELGARGHAEGAPGGRRHRAGQPNSWKRSGRSSGAGTSISPPSPTSTP